MAEFSRTVAPDCSDDILHDDAVALVATLKAHRSTDLGSQERPGRRLPLLLVWPLMLALAVPYYLLIGLITMVGWTQGAPINGRRTLTGRARTGT